MYTCTFMCMCTINMQMEGNPAKETLSPVASVLGKDTKKNPRCYQLQESLLTIRKERISHRVGQYWESENT